MLLKNYDQLSEGTIKFITSITFDSGYFNKFARISFSFCDPGASFQKGQIEITNPNLL